MEIENESIGYQELRTTKGNHLHGWVIDNKGVSNTKEGIFQFLGIKEIKRGN